MAIEKKYRVFRTRLHPRPKPPFDLLVLDRATRTIVRGNEAKHHHGELIGEIQTRYPKTVIRPKLHAIRAVIEADHFLVQTPELNRKPTGEELHAIADALSHPAQDDLPVKVTLWKKSERREEGNVITLGTVGQLKRSKLEEIDSLIERV